MAEIGKVVRGNHFAKCAIETALLDFFAKRRGLPISDFFGGRFRDRLPIVWTLASGDTARDIAEAQEMLDRRRHRTFKLKIGAGEPKQRHRACRSHQASCWATTRACASM